jgi:hypothetical protein
MKALGLIVAGLALAIVLVVLGMWLGALGHQLERHIHTPLLREASMIQNYQRYIDHIDANDINTFRQHLAIKRDMSILTLSSAYELSTLTPDHEFALGILADVAVSRLVDDTAHALPEKSQELLSFAHQWKYGHIDE